MHTTPLKVVLDIAFTVDPSDPIGFYLKKATYCPVIGLWVSKSADRVLIRVDAHRADDLYSVVDLYNLTAKVKMTNPVLMGCSIGEGSNASHVVKDLSIYSRMRKQFFCEPECQG